MATVSLQGAKMGYDTLLGEKKITVVLRGQMDYYFFKNAEKVHKTQQKLNKTQ